MKNINKFLSLGLILTLFGCASPEKAELKSGTNPESAVSEVEQLMQKAESEQSDLLSASEFNDGVKFFDRAKRGLSAGHESELILNNAAFAKAQFEKARMQSGVRSTNATRMLAARKSMLNAGLRDSETLVLELADVDDDLRSETDNFSEALEPEEFSEFQKKYLALEIKAVQNREIGVSREAIQRSVVNDAEDLAPETLKAARFDLNESENLIAQSPRNPEIHKASVEKSLASSLLLLDVMDVILDAEGTPENIALKIVMQNRELGILSKNVGQLEQSLETTQSNLQATQSNLATTQSSLQVTQSNLMETEGALKKKDEELAKSATQVKFQKAMDEARANFSEDEASVYQQGSNLIFRLKKINFPTGSAIIPEPSKPLLSKVNEIIRALGAEKVVVQGHTDSIGAETINKKLSTDRAISVANYLASLAAGYKLTFIGYGETKPIATNETKQGRAINRRVDLVVTAKK